MILGFSDATLHVVKRGPEARDQGQLCQYLGSDIAPMINQLLEDGYEMEILEEPKSRGRTELNIVIHRLEMFVWNRQCYRDWMFGWLEPLRQWARDTAYWKILEAIDAMYPDEPRFGYCLIHGDPTLANVMMRRDYHVITDPMPRLEYRKEIPNLQEVDLGKLIQSALGWEHMLGCQGETLFGQEQIILRRFPSRARGALLWASIHLARVARRAPKKDRMDIAGWADEMSSDMIKQFWRMDK